MAGLKILIGADKSAPVYEFEYSKSHIMSFSGIAASSLVGDELTIDRVTFTVNLDKYYRTLYSPTNADAYHDTQDRLYAVKEEPGSLAGDLSKLEYATPVWVYQNDNLVGKFYSGDIERTAYAVVSITVESALGVLDRQQHLGDVYTGQLFPAVLAEIIGGTFPFTVSDALSAVKVYNWLPIDSRRNNIHQLLYAHGANLTKDKNGDMVFDFLQQTVAAPVPDERLFLNGSAKHTPPATRVEVMEHSFFKLSTDTDVVLFDNTDGAAPAGNSFVAFQEAPVYGLVASSGLVIHESGVNYAIVSGVGKLTGKRYNHQTNRVGRDNESATGVEKIVSSDGCTLVSVLNSSNVTRRLLSYYSSAQTFSMDIAVEGERPGDQLQFMSPFGDLTAAFLASMQYSITGFMRARCELVTNYEPTPPGGGDYTHVEVITASGTWTVPEGVTEFTAVLIGGGSGGTGGYDGEAGENGSNATASAGSTSTSNGGSGGKGGAAGAAGNGGRIFQARIEANAGAQFSASIAAGGKGGARNGGIGSVGGNTTFSGAGYSYTSANGAISPAGYFDVMGQTVYAAAGSPGVSGGVGGSGSDGANATTGQSGENVGGSSGGVGGATTYENRNKTSYEKPERTNFGKIRKYCRTNNAHPSDFTVAPALMEQILDLGYGSITGPFYDYGESITDDPETYIKSYWDQYQVNSDSGEWETSLSIGTIYEPSASWQIRWISQKNERELRLVCFIINATGEDNTFVHYSNYISVSRASGFSYTKSGSGGGGAGNGAPGGNALGDSGGRGANATATSPSALFGSGGNGGNGGGGGGGGGGVQLFTQADAASITVPGGSGGSGGLGSPGGDGAPGCVLIYY